MNLLTPWLLAGLAVLPVLWWLLRATPPAPRLQEFPAIRLLEGLQPRQETAARTPWWLLALRLAAVALLVVGLAEPVLTPARDPLREALPGRGPLVLVIDDDWAAATDWAARLRNADAVLARAEQAGRQAILIATADDGAGEAPAATAPMPAAVLRSRVAALRPMPWAADRKAAAAALDALPAENDAAYVADGVAGPDDVVFGAALGRHVHRVTLAGTGAPILIRVPKLHAAGADDGVSAGLALDIRLETLPGAARSVDVLAEDRDGLVLARRQGHFEAGARSADVAFALPAELRNRITRLRVAGAADAGAVRLLDEGDRRRPVGLLTAGSGDDTRLLGATFYLRRALSGAAELREGGLDVLLSRQLSVLVAPDGALAQTLADPARRDRLRDWIARGGMLLRFAGPRLAAAGSAAPQDGAASPDPNAAAPPGDPFLPVPLLDGTRQLGGAMSWSTPEHLAPFGADTPFAGLTSPHDVAVRRQVLAAPSGTLAGLTWARIEDGTPLVTHHALGDGQIVLFHVTSNADWSDLPLSGLFPQMLVRLMRRAVGVAGAEDDALLAPEQTLDGFGALVPPPPAARGLAANALATTQATPQHPPGLYGPATQRRALNLGDAAPLLAAEALPAPVLSLAAVRAARPLGPWLVALGLLLLAVDQLAVLMLRGGSRRRFRLGRSAMAAVTLAAILQAGAAQAVTAPEAGDVPPGALQTTLAYVETGDRQTDQISQQGLAGLSDYVNQRTSASLGHPVGVRPGRDDLSFYPLLYWPIRPDARPDPQAQAALNDYMAHGGMLLIDTQGGDTGGTGSGAGFAAGAGAALRRVAAGLDVPPLARLDDRHVLAHTFYLLRDFPGRFAGSPVWVAAGQKDADEGSDAVSPVIIGANDWAAAWAVDASGNAPYAAIPGGDRQRQMAFRFGVNAVIYALTGNYKADQVHVPALLERLGE